MTSAWIVRGTPCKLAVPRGAANAARSFATERVTTGIGHGCTKIRRRSSDESQ